MTARLDDEDLNWPEELREAGRQVHLDQSQPLFESLRTTGLAAWNAQTDFSAPPSRAVCHIVMRARSSSGFVEVAHGTGFLAGSRLIVTAAHNEIVRDSTTYSVRMADGAAGALIEVKTKVVRRRQGYRRLGDWAFDLASIFLPDDKVANMVGAPLTCAAAKPSDFGGPVSIYGYPYEGPPAKAKPFPTQWSSVGVSHRPTKPGELSYELGNERGMSGGPVLRAAAPTVAVGVHVRPGGAKLFEEEDILQIDKWRKESSVL